MSKHRAVLRALADWFDRQKRVLPWRESPTPYRVWVSEIMLQQTQVVTVLPYFERFIANFPTVQDLAGADEQSVLLAWAGLGYYSRARNIHRGAKEIVAKGFFPTNREEWLEIPGVGPYTAGAIASIALDQVEPILDGNVERVLSRWGRIGRGASESSYKEILWNNARDVVERAAQLDIRPSVINQALMELGAMICSPKQPKCQICPVSKGCGAFANEEVSLFPSPKKPKSWVLIQEEVHCHMDARGRILLEKSDHGAWRSGLWDFPRQKISGAKLKVVGEIQTRHVVTRHKITRRTQVWRVTGLWQAAESNLSVSPSQRWVDPLNLDVPVGSALRKVVQSLRERYTD